MQHQPHSERHTADRVHRASSVLPAISVVVPTRGRPAALAACVDAIGRLDYPRELLELVVVDDNSPEPIGSRLGRPDHLSMRVIRQQRTGPAGARNAGADAAEGGVLAFIDDDCTPAADWLRRVVEPLHGGARVIAGGETVNVLTDNACAEASQDLVSYLYEHYSTTRPSMRYFTTNNLALRRDLFREVGGFDTRFRHPAGEDREFCIRCLTHGIELVHVPDAVVYHAHSLTVPSFCAQHFTYGREAYRFHSLRHPAGRRRFVVEPPSFYTRMLTYPFRRRDRHVVRVAGLLGVSQLANTCGFLWEATRSGVVSRARRRRAPGT